MEEGTRLFLIRHGETTASSEFRYVGHMDVDITENGIEQMNKLKHRFKCEEINALFSSDLIRTKKGAKIISSCHKIDPVDYREFREINLGIWEGLTRDEIMERFPREHRQRLDDLPNYRIQGG